VTQEQEPPNEPRTVSARTDLSGLNAILFVTLVIVAFVAGAFLLFNFIVIGSGPATPPPSLPVATATRPPTSEEPGSASVGPSEPLGATLLPSEPAVNLPGEPVDVHVGGNVVGSVTVTELRWPAQIKGDDPPRNALWLTAKVKYDASEGDIAYATGDWTVIDESHVVIEPSTVQRAPELDSGTVTNGNIKEAYVTFLVPTNTTVLLHFANGETVADFKVKPR
jgi:hypothetical protein